MRVLILILDLYLRRKWYILFNTTKTKRANATQPGLSCFWIPCVVNNHSIEVDNTIDKIDHDVIKLKHFPHYRTFVWEIHPSQLNPKGQWRGALMFPLICAWINGSANNREAGDLRRHRAHYDVTVIYTRFSLRRVLWLVGIVYNMVCSELFFQRALYTVHCTNIMHSRKPSLMITPPFLINTVDRFL